MDKQREEFENCFKNTEIYKRELSIRGKDILEFSSSFGYHNIVVNEAYLMWQQAKKNAVPAGFKLVPIEPPEGMDLKICNMVDHRIDCFEADRIYKAMIEAQDNTT